MNKIVIVDDEPDIHTVSEMVLRKLRFREEPVQMFFLPDGKSLLEHMREHPDTAVILLDVVMEDEEAGLRAVKHIREDLLNTVVRILLRTGQPGRAPEKEIIENYDIDGYLAKAELTHTRLFSTVRTALKNFYELLSLQQHRDMFWQVSQLMIKMTESKNLQECLESCVQSTTLLMSCPFSALYLQSHEVAEGVPPYLQIVSDADAVNLPEHDAVMKALNPEVLAASTWDNLSPWHQGQRLRFRAPRTAREGLLYLPRQPLSTLEQQVLQLLVSQTSFAIDMFTHSR